MVELSRYVPPRLRGVIMLAKEAVMEHKVSLVAFLTLICFKYFA